MRLAFRVGLSPSRCVCVHNVLASVAARILVRHTLCCGKYIVSSLYFQWFFLFAWRFSFLLGRSVGSKPQFFSHLEVEYWRFVKKAYKIFFHATILQTDKKQVERANLKLPKYDDIPLIRNFFFFNSLHRFWWLQNVGCLWPAVWRSCGTSPVPLRGRLFSRASSTL